MLGAAVWLVLARQRLIPRRNGRRRLPRPHSCGGLKAESVETHKHLGPWVAALLVAPKYRRQGIRAQLVGAPGGARTPDHLGNRSMRCSTSYVRVVVVRSRYVEST